MKTAISIDDTVFEQAELAAKELGISRSSLYSQAIQEFVEQHLPNLITEKYNEIYAQVPSDPEISRVAHDVLSKVEW